MIFGKKLLISLLLASTLFTNSCATIMTNWEETKNSGNDISEIERKITKEVFLPTIETSGKNLKLVLRNQSFFEVKQKEINKFKKDLKWGWGITIPLVYLTGIGIGLASFGSNFINGDPNSQMALVSFLAITALTIGDLVWANSLSQETLETKDVTKEEIKETFLSNSKVTLIVDDSIYSGISDDKGFLELSNIEVDFDKPAKNIDLKVKTYEGKELIAKISQEILKPLATIFPPKITILEPSFGERGINIVSKEKSLMLKGIAESKKGIAKVLINGNEIKLENNNVFSYKMSLSNSDNEISIVAIDNKNNKTEKKIIINREDLSSNISAINNFSHNSERLNWYKSQYALVVGLDHYENSQIPILKNAVNDAKSVSQIFKRMGFQVKELYNSKATKKEIINAFREMAKKTGKDDSFIFYFAGHGQGLSSEKNKREGFIVPFDTSFDLSSGSLIDYDQEAISIDTIKKYSGSMRAKHIGLLLDSCFSGLALKRSISKMELNYDLNYYNNLLSRKSINILTAGDDQPVSDGSAHSPFAQALIMALEKNSLITGNKDNFVLFRDLSVYVKDKVERSTEGRQRPQFDNLSDDDGDFIFKIR